jgi:hypothetical protein
VFPRTSAVGIEMHGTAIKFRFLTKFRDEEPTELVPR